MFSKRKMLTLILIPLVLFLVQGTAFANINVSAGSAILMEASTGQVLYDKNADVALPPASITKVMTLLLIFEAIEREQISWDDIVITSENAWRMTGSQMYLNINQEITVRDIVKGISIISANDACVAIAEHLYGSENAFVRVMNERAQELGLTNTRFQNSTGWPADNHVMSARDIATLSQYLLSTFPEVIDFESQREFTFNDIRQYNRNTLLGRFPGADGLKTGWTSEAGYCLVGTAVQDDTRLIAVVLNTISEQERLKVSQELLNYGFRNFKKQVIATPGDLVGEANIIEGRKRTLKVTVKEEYAVFLPFDNDDELVKVIKPREELVAPVEAGEYAATLEVYANNEMISSVQLVAQEDMKRANFFVRGFRWIGNLFGGLFSRG